MDYVDFVVHIFLKEKRAYYDIERLRKSAKHLDMADLKAALTKKTLEARKKSPVKAGAKAVSKKAAAKRVSARKAVPEKTAAKKAVKSPVKKATRTIGAPSS